MRLPNAEDPSERPDYITNIINGLERYNPEAVGTLESYLTLQCEEKFCDCNANRTLLKLYGQSPSFFAGVLLCFVHRYPRHLLHDAFINVSYYLKCPRGVTPWPAASAFPSSEGLAWGT